VFKLPEIHPNVLAVKLTPQGEQSVRKEHPWIFSDSILKINGDGKVGDIAVIFSFKSNKVLGVGLLDPYSPIRIKMLHFGGGTQLNSIYFKKQVQNAFQKRTPLFSTNTNSYRLLFGENDGFPGLIADVYNHVLVIKLYSGIWLPFLNIILDELIHISKVDAVVFRLSRRLEKLTDLNIPPDGYVIYGHLDNETVVFNEHGVRFSANVIKGHKTGYFLDHRHNRKRVGELSNDKSVLDVFAYAGGFSVHALHGGAKEVTSVDISEQALELAKANASLNDFEGKHKILAGDAFDILQKLVGDGCFYDIVVIDPPSFAKKASEVPLALKKYEQLANLGIQLTKRGGVLILASCSSRVSAEQFYEVNAQAFDSSNRKVQLLETTSHDTDHPVGFPEGAYLKCGYYKIN